MPRSAPRWEPVLLLLVLVGTVLTYWGAWRGGFVFDDQAMVVQHQLVADISRWPEMFTTDLWESSAVLQWQSGYYRPLVLLDLAVDRALFGLSPTAFHLHSLAWHLLSIVLAWGLLRRLVPWAGALAGTIVLAVHPACSEAVIWIAARNDVMALALALLALSLVQPVRAAPGRLVLGALASLAALLSKESVLLLPLWLGCLDLAGGVSLRSGWRRYAAVLVGLGTGIGMRAIAGVAASSASGPEGWQTLLVALPQFLGTVGASLVMPWPLSVVRHISWIHLEPTWRVSLGVVGLVVIVLAPLLRRGRDRRVAAAGVAWGVVAIAPVVFAVASRALYGDRYVHVGIFGLALWFVGVLGRAALPVALALAVPATLMIRDRVPDWESNERLFSAAVADAPNPWAHVALGNTLREQGRDAEAVPHYVAALSAEPPAVAACTQVIRASIEAGDLVGARGHALVALDRGCPETGPHLALLAMLHLRLGDAEAAREVRARASGREDPVGWDLRVDAALARLNGDTARYEAIAEAWTRDRPLEADVEWLLAAYSTPGEP